MSIGKFHSDGKLKVDSGLTIFTNISEHAYMTTSGLALTLTFAFLITNETCSYLCPTAGTWSI